jgi:hypothetical protein
MLNLRNFKNSVPLGGETRHETPSPVTSTGILETPRQNSMSPTLSMIYRQASPDATTTDFIEKPYKDKAKKGDMR